MRPRRWSYFFEFGSFRKGCIGSTRLFARRFVFLSLADLVFRKHFSRVVGIGVSNGGAANSKTRENMTTGDRPPGRALRAALGRPSARVTRRRSRGSSRRTHILPTIGGMASHRFPTRAFRLPPRRGSAVARALGMRPPCASEMCLRMRPTTCCASRAIDQLHMDALRFAREQRGVSPACARGFASATAARCALGKTGRRPVHSVG